MKKAQNTIRALGLCSGGLDSILAALVLRDQGIEVEWITFTTPFFSAGKAEAAARRTGIRLHVENITERYLEMLKNPRAGYGQHMNPCMDCHALMFHLAGRKMEAEGYRFLFSGEVLGQRPMSQTRSSLRYVEKHSGYEGYILRPLSALKLPETEPERLGWVDRDRLQDIAGRSRKRQIALAADYGITEYPTPAGGCLLTDKQYSQRLRDLFAHEKQVDEAALHMLKYGRHFRLDSATKLIVGRTRKENEKLGGLYRPGVDIMLKTDRFPGPLALIPGGGDWENVRFAAAICAGYSKAPDDAAATVSVTTPQGVKTVRVFGKPPAEVKNLLI